VPRDKGGIVHPSNRFRSIATGLVVVGVLALLPGPALAAGEPYSYEAALLGGVGGSTDVDPSAGYDHFGFQINLGMVTEPRTHVVLRLGRSDLADDRGFGTLRDGSLTYANVAGEYRFRYSYYDSGLFPGLGVYDFSGTGRDGRSRDQQSIGLGLGVTADFPIQRHWSALVELSGHYADLGEAQFFTFLHAGVSYKF
jgi:hypothetical protein